MPAGHAFGILQSGSDGDNLDAQYSLFGNSTSKQIANAANANGSDAVIQTSLERQIHKTNMVVFKF